MAALIRCRFGIYFRLLSQSCVRAPHNLEVNPFEPERPAPSCWINPAAFKSPDLGTLSTMRRNNIPGPRLWTFDTAFSREFTVGGRGRLEFRGEAFNVTNSMRPGISLPSLLAGAPGLGLTFGSATFGQITGSQDPRILQLALRYSF